MKLLLGEGGYALLESSYEKENVRGLRLNTLKRIAEDSDNLIEHFNLRHIPFTESGYYFDEKDFPGRSPYHDAGAYYIQDPGAMVPARVLEEYEFFFPERKMKILDLCAAPGGKSTQIAAAMKGQGILICNEINRSRADVLSQNIERMGITNAIVTNETPERLSEYFESFFDEVIVDAPCSGEGMFRKDPEAVNEWSEESVEKCAKRQREILDSAYKMLRPGGVIVYSTCTFEKCENEDIISDFTCRYPDMKQADTGRMKEKFPGVRDGLPPCENAFRMWPMYFEGEGQFASLLKKDGDLEGALPLNGYERPSKIKDKKALDIFLKESLSVEASEHIIKSECRYKLNGDNLYIFPKGAPDMSGLKLLRNGLHVGAFKKDRFEPSHALSHVLSEGDVKNTVRLSEEQAEEYLHGMTLEGDGNGWCLITVGGYSLGWGKVSSGRIKNHYPKGLRLT